MTPAAAADLAFLAPGFVHHFGNLLFAMQGQLLQAEPTAAAGPLQAIANSVDRGAAALRIVRHLLGDGGPELGDAGHAMTELCELARVGARERGHRVAPPAADGSDLAVDLAAFVPAVTAALRACLEAAPAGATVVLQWQAAGERLDVALQPAAGSLPFPFPGAAVESAWRARAAAAGWPYDIAGAANGLQLQIRRQA